MDNSTISENYVSHLNSYGKNISKAIDELSVVGRYGTELASSAKFNNILPGGIGAGIDFVAQLSDKKDIKEAAIKTAGHALAGTVATLGVAVIVAAAPFEIAAGSAIVATIAVGTAGSMIFDYVYDNTEN